MRLRATAAGLEPIIGARHEHMQPMRRSWLKRLGGVLLGTAVAAPAVAAPRQIAGSQDYFIGEIMLFAGNFAPAGWQFCDGSLLPINDNEALFSLISTTYGGDGETTFGLPDLRGRAPRHMGTGPGLSPYTLGQVGGVETRTLSAAQIPAHTHELKANTVPTSSNPVGNVPAALVGTDVNGETVSVLAYGPLPPTATALAGTVQPVGNGEVVDIMAPYLAMNYCISLYGAYPSS